MSKTEKAIITTLCMIYKDNQILMQDKKSGWKGLTLPGGHIEKEESFVKGTIREIFEETGLTIHKPQLCGIKQFQTDDEERYIVIYYKTNEFEGELTSSDEGDMIWMNREDLTIENTAKGFLDTLKTFDDDSISEMIYERYKKDDGYEWVLRYY